MLVLGFVSPSSCRIGETVDTYSTHLTQKTIGFVSSLGSSPRVGEVLSGHISHCPHIDIGFVSSPGLSVNAGSVCRVVTTIIRLLAAILAGSASFRRFSALWASPLERGIGPGQHHDCLRVDAGPFLKDGDTSRQEVC